MPRSAEGPKQEPQERRTEDDAGDQTDEDASKEGGHKRKAGTRETMKTGCRQTTHDNTMTKTRATEPSHPVAQ